MYLTQQNQTLETNQLTNKTQNVINFNINSMATNILEYF